MNKKNLYVALGAVFLVSIHVLVFVGMRTAHGADAPGTASFRDYRDLTEFAAERGFYVIFAKGGKHNPKSLHPKGRAVDIRTWDHTPEEVEEFMQEAKAAGLRVVDERCKPKNKKVVWDAPHVHLEISKKASKSEKNQCPDSTPTPDENIAATQNAYQACRESFSQCNNTKCTGKKSGPGSACFKSCSNKENKCITSNMKKLKITTPPAPEPITEPTPEPAPAPTPVPAPAPAPAPEQTPVSGSVTSITCQVVQLNAGIGGTVDYYDAIIKGTASGPVNSYFNGGVAICDSWRDCNRGENDPPTTLWTDTQRVYVSRDELADPTYNGATTNEISIGPPRPTTIILPNHTKVCPQ